MVKCIKERKIAEANAYKEHCIDQAITVLAGGHDIKCMFTTPKLLAAFDEALRATASSKQVPRAEEGDPEPAG